MERNMLRIKIKDRITSPGIRKQTKIIAAAKKMACRLKWRRTRYLARFTADGGRGCSTGNHDLTVCRDERPKLAGLHYPGSGSNVDATSSGQGLVTQDGEGLRPEMGFAINIKSYI